MAEAGMIAVDTNILVYAQRHDLPLSQMAFNLMNVFSKGSEP